MRINHNLMAMNTHRMLGQTNLHGAKSMEKLSSGYRINRAGDDAAGLAISEKMRAQIRGLNQASRNSQDAISLIQTAEGALNETHSILQRMRELAVQASSDTNVAVDRDQIQKEINQLTSEINRIGNTTEFNTMKLLDGSKSVNSRDLTSTVRTIAVDGTFTANYADGVAAVAGMTDTDVILSGQITLDNTAGTDVADLVGTAGSTIQITKGTAANTFEVAVKLVNSTGTTLTSTETYEYSADSDFTYDNHGISFTIEKEDFSKFTATGTGLSIDFDSTDVTAGNVAAASDWNSNTTSSAATITSGVTVTVGSELEGAREIEIDWSSGSGTGSGTLKVIAKDSGGNTILSDIYAITTGAYSYDHNGISFEFNANAATTANITFSLDTTQTNASSTTVDRSLSFQIGANENQSMSLSLNDMRAVALGISSTTAQDNFTSSTVVTNGTDNTTVEYALDVSTHEAAANAVTVINNAINNVSEERAKLGAVQNRLEHTINNLDTASENLQASESRIRDVDMAKEMMEFTKNNILQQAAQAMLAQANQAPQGVLSLLR